MSSYIIQGKRLLELAIQEFNKANGNESKIYQAGEKAWLAVVKATNGLIHIC